MNINSKEFAKKLESDYITHISFLMDYLAIGFNSGTLTAFLPPSIIIDEESWHWQQPGYNDKLISLIQLKVISVDLNEDEKYFQVILEDGVELLISWQKSRREITEVFILNIESEVLII